MRQFTHLFAHLNANKRVTIRFFAVFSRFEFAMKHGGYAKGDAKQVAADWDLLATNLGSHFNPKRTKKLIEAVDYLIQSPPKKQVLKGGVLDWEDSFDIRKGTVLLPLFLYVRRMRNNLFHGGKHTGDAMADPERNTTLLRHGVKILHECLTLCEQHEPKLYSAFHEIK